MYVTPARYRTMGFGTDLSEIEDGELAVQLGVAGRLASRFCGLPTGYDFRGGSVTAETHVWDLGNAHVPGSGRVIVESPPLLTLTEFKIQVTNTQYLDINPDRVFYDPERNTLEPVIAASSIGVWSYSAIPVAGLREPRALVSYTYGYTFSVTDEELFPEGGSTFRGQNQWWTADDVEVKINGTVVDPDDYTVDRTEGTIKFSDPPDPEIDTDISEGGVVTASYSYRLPPEVRDAVGIITTDLLGARNVVGAGLLGLSGIRAEEIELRISRDQRITGGEINDRAKMLLAPYKRLVWG